MPPRKIVSGCVSNDIKKNDHELDCVVKNSINKLDNNGLDDFEEEEEEER
jgi:hypothetical protein